MKRKLCALLAGLLVFTTITAACQTKDDDAKSAGAASTQTAAEIPELAKQYKEFETPRTETVTWFEQGWTGMDEELDIVTPEIAKRTNFNFVYESMTVPTAEDYKQKLNLMISGDEVPKIFFGGADSFTWDVYEQLGDAGKLWDVSEIIQDYPNLSKLLEPELIKFKTKEGKNYFVPTQTGRGNDVVDQAVHGMFANEQFLKQLNMDLPETPEELYTYLKRATEEIKIDGQPATGLLVGENLAGLENIYDAFFPNIGIEHVRDLPFDEKNNFEVQNFLYTDSAELMDAMKFINRLASENLLDKECLTIKTTQFEEKASSGRPAVLATTWWDINKFTDIIATTNPDIFFPRINKFFSNDAVREARTSKKWTYWVGSWSSLIISKEVPEETVRHLLAVMDYMATTEGQLLTQAGIEGETYTINEDGKFVMTDDFLEKTNNMDWNQAAAYGVGYYTQLVFNIPAIRDIRQTPPTLLREDNMKNWEANKWYWDLFDPNMEPTPDYYFVPGPIESAKWPAILEARKEFFAKVIAAKPEEVEGIVKEWAETCKSYGIEEIVKERAEILEEAKEKIKK